MKRKGRDKTENSLWIAKTDDTKVGIGMIGLPRKPIKASGFLNEKSLVSKRVECVPRYACLNSLTHPEVAAICEEKLLDFVSFHTDIMITIARMCL
jgi:hypothetical protein